MTVNQPIIQDTSVDKPGFSLVEALVAIAVLLSVVSGVMALVDQSIRFGESVTSRLAASYLASDAIEYIRYDRDSYWLRESDGFDKWYGDGKLSNCQSNVCTIDTRDVGSGNSNISQCNNGCDPLMYNEGQQSYGHENTGGSGWEESEFTRELRVLETNDLGSGSSGIDEVIVEVTVTWPEAGGSDGELVLTDTVTAWAD